MGTVPGYADCSYELRHSGLPRSAFLTFGCDPSGTDPQTVADQLQACFGAAGSLLTCIDSSVSLVRTRVSLGTDGGEDIVAVNSTVVACTWSGGTLPPNVAALVHKYTARGGRRGRGRMYIPWACANISASEVGTMQAADVTRIGSAVSAWRAQLATNPGPLVLLHRESKEGTLHPTPPGPPNLVTSHAVDPMVATQRRRLGR